eukprot:TRINITY_DN5143_c0_g2_i1.p1 TRINITY_DN5143_c0_g2~~TRINITY_DN5143_c0_g2_i1.p1  ORF type:complete len:463 (+),score=82.11 TRINITY_DN5143_c0_g2_i1:53-1441(+)
MFSGAASERPRRLSQGVPSQPAILNGRAFPEAGNHNIKKSHEQTHDPHKATVKPKSKPSRVLDYEYLYKRLSATITEVLSSLRSSITTETKSELTRLNISLDDIVDNISGSSDPISQVLSLKEIIIYISQRKETLEADFRKREDLECSEYEAHMQKLEAEVRQHIRIEQQLKLFAENTQSKLEEVTKSLADLKKEKDILATRNKENCDLLDAKSIETEMLKRELEVLRMRLMNEEIRSYNSNEKANPSALRGRVTTRVYSLPKKEEVSVHPHLEKSQSKVLSTLTKIMDTSSTIVKTLEDENNLCNSFRQHSKASLLNKSDIAMTQRKSSALIGEGGGPLPGMDVNGTSLTQSERRGSAKLDVSRERISNENSNTSKIMSANVSYSQHSQSLEYLPHSQAPLQMIEGITGVLPPVYSIARNEQEEASYLAKLKDPNGSMLNGVQKPITGSSLLHCPSNRNKY